MTKRQLKSWPLRMSLFIIVPALVGVALSCSSPTPPSSPEELGLIAVEIEAPDFTLPTMTDREITLSELQGTPVVLNCWAIRCPPCREELPYFNAAVNHYADRVTIVAVNIEDSISEVKGFFGDSKVSFVVAIDKNAQVAKSYATGYIPNTFFIDSQGIIRYIKVGAFANEGELQASIDALLNK
mgnify:CR=1 FL=1